MKKKFLLLALTPILLVSTGCSFLFNYESSSKSNEYSSKNVGEFDWADFSNNTHAFNKKSDKIANYDLSFDNTGYENCKSKIRLVVSSGIGVRLLETYYTNLNDYVESILSKYFVANAFYYGDPNETTRSKQNSFLSLYYDAVDFYSEMRLAAAESRNSNIRTAYFGDMTDEEIQAEVAGDKNTATINALNEEINDIENSMKELNNNKANISTDSYVDQTIDLYFDLITKGNTIAALEGYDNYLDYQYAESFSRSYSVTQASQMPQFVKQYLIPMYQSMNVEKGSHFDSNLYTSIKSDNLAKNNGETGRYLTSMIKNLSSKYYNIYNDLWINGYYYFSDNPSLGTAYSANMYAEGTHMVFFGNDYQTMNSVCHEFGHYNAGEANDTNDSKPLDVSETHSQGLEYLLLEYIKEENVNDTYNFYCDDYVKNEISYMFNFASIVEVEEYAFNGVEKTKEEFKNQVNNIISSYNGLAKSTYWCYPCVASCGYYVSYLTSLVASLQLYNTPFETGKQKYISLVEDTENTTEIKCWTDAGFLSPFTQEAYTYLNNILVK